MAWNDEPPTADELGEAAPAVAVKPSDNPQDKPSSLAPADAPLPPASEDWAQEPPHKDDLGYNNFNHPVSTAEDLIKKGYLFDDYWKLPAEEKKRFDSLTRERQAANAQGLATGIQTGFPKVAGIGTDTLTGIQGEAERVIANALGDEDTQKLYSSIPQEQLTASYQAPIDEANKNAPEALEIGQGLAALPAAIGLGGLTGAGATSAASGLELGPIATKAAQGLANTATAGGMGELQGIAQSSAPTLEEKAQEALPTAAAAALGGAALEGVVAGAPRALSAIASGAKDLRNTFARRSLGGTATDVARLKPIQAELGEQLFPADGKNLIGPFSTQEKIAENIANARKVTGQNVGDSLANIDAAASQKLASEQATVPVKAPGADVPEIESSAIKNAYPNQLAKDPALNAKASSELLTADQPGLHVDKIINPDAEILVNHKIEIAPMEVKKQVAELISPANIATDVEKALQSDPKLAAQYAIQQPTEVKDKISQELSKLASMKNPDLKTLFRYRMDLDDTINYNKVPNAFGGKDDSPISSALKLYRNELDKKLMSSAQQIDSLTGAESFKTLQDAKARYSVLSKANNVAQRAANKAETLAAKSIAPAAGAAAMKGGAALLGGTAALPLTAAGAVGGYAAKKYGNAFAASSLNLLQNAVKNTPAVFGEFAAPLEQAAARGGSSLAAMHFALYNKDPKYRQIIDPLQEQGEEESK